MQRLWDEERAAGSTVLRVATLRTASVVRSTSSKSTSKGRWPNSAADQKDIAARLFNHLVTPSGTKIAHDVSDLADFGEVPVSTVGPVLVELTGRRILRSLEEGGRSGTRSSTTCSRSRSSRGGSGTRATRELEAQKRASDRRHRQLLAIIGAGAVLLAIMGAVTVYAVTQRSEARQQARHARANELVATADSELGRDRS